MACNISPPIFFLLVSSLLSLSCVILAQDAVNKVCAKTSNPGFCIAVLRSDRRSATADYTGLGYVAIDLATSSITSSYNKIMMLDRQTRDPGLKKHLDVCVIEYDSAVGYCDSSREALDKKLYKSLYVGGDALSMFANDCETGFKAFKPYYPSPLTSNNRNTELFAEIIKAIAVLLKTS